MYSKRHLAQRAERRRKILRALSVVGALVIVVAAFTAYRLYQIDPEREFARALTNAQAYADAEDWKSAAIEYRNAVKHKPNDAELRRTLGYTYEEIGATRAAIKEFSKAIELGMSDPRMSKTMIRGLASVGEYEDALTEIRKLDAAGVDISDLKVIEAQASLSEGSLDDARAQFDDIVSDQPDSVEALLGLARLSAAENDIATALEYLDRALQVAPENAQVLVMKGEMTLANNDVQQAKELFNAAAQTANPQLRSVAQSGLVRVLIAEQDLSGARAVLGKIDKRIGGTIVDYYAALITYFEGDYKTAVEGFTDFLNAVPNYPPALLLSGHSLYEQGEFAQAEAKLSQLLELTSNSMPGRRLLAATQLQLNRPQSARDTLEYFAPDDIEDASYHEIYASVLLSLGESELSNRHLAIARKLNPAIEERINTKLAFGNLAAGEIDLAVTQLKAPAESNVDETAREVLLTYALLRKERFDDALDVAREFLTRNPGAPLPSLLVGMVHVQRGELPLARAKFEDALRKDPSYLVAHLNLADLSIRENELDAARVAADRAIEIEPKYVNAYLVRARIEALAGNNEEAFQWVTRAAEENPRALKPRMMAAEALLQSNRPEAALPYIEAAAQLAPEDPIVLKQHFTVSLRLRDLDTARQILSTLKRTQSNDPAVALFGPRLHIAEGNYDQANAELTALIGEHPDQTAVLSQLFTVSLAREDLPAAREYLASLNERGVGGVGMQRLRARLAQAEGDSAGVLRAYQAIMREAPSASAALDLSRAYFAAGQTDEAEALALSWLDRDPAAERPFRRFYAGLLVNSDREAEAIDQYETLEKAHPGDFIVLNNLAYLYQKRDDARALEYAKRAYETAPERFQTLDTYGWILVESGDVEQGLSLLKQAQARADDNPDINYHLASAYARSGDRVSAVKYLKRALASPTAFAERDSASRLLSLLGGSGSQ